jgi:hypothetical protein
MHHHDTAYTSGARYSHFLRHTADTRYDYALD